MREGLHKLDGVDVAALDHLAEDDLKSVGRLLGRVERIDLEGLGTNANALLTELRCSNAKLQSFLDHTDDTIAKMKLDKLAHDADDLSHSFKRRLGVSNPAWRTLISMHSIKHWTRLHARCMRRTMFYSS